MNQNYRRGVTKRKYKTRSPVEIPADIQALMVKMYVAGHSANTVTSKYGYNTTKVNDLMKRRGVFRDPKEQPWREVDRVKAIGKKPRFGHLK